MGLGLGGEVGEGDVGEAGEEGGFGVAEGGVEGVVDGLFDGAVGVVVGGADGEEGWFAEGEVDVEDGDLVERAGEEPAAAMTLFGLDDAVVAETGHGAADDDGVGVEHLGDVFGRGSSTVIVHVE